MTDPPYNVDYVGGTKDALKMCNDAMSADDFNDFLVAAFTQLRESLKDGGAFYIWYAGLKHVAFETALKKAGLTVRQQLIWVKSNMALGWQDYQWKHEPCLYGWKDGATHYFAADRTHTTVAESENLVNYKTLKKPDLVRFCDELIRKLDAEPSTVVREDKSTASEKHPTMKPTRLMARLIANSTAHGDVVLDLFGGSGSTLIACEQLNRTCCMIKIDPKYCDVIIDRYEKFTGNKAEKVCHTN